MSVKELKTENTLQQIAERIKKAKRIVIVTHMRPDGDALGSALALSTALNNLKIANQVCDETDIPSNLSFLNGLESVKKKPQGNYDLLIAVDCSDEQRMGALSEELFLAKKNRIDVINIDHHISNNRFGQYNFVQVCASNCMNIAKLIDCLGAQIDKKTAEYLLLGLLTDSGNFSHDDVGEEILALAARLVKAGANIRDFNYQLFKKQPKARAKLHAKVMGGMRFYHEDRFAVITITKRAMEECGADNGMTEGFVDFPLNVDTVEIAASVMEVKAGQYKISLRSKNYADVNRLAGTYGGGGHIRAAGCMLFGDLEDVLDRLSYTAYQYLED
ncbi:MAG: bifunctional oligoribonuclease/PAP phosphatase NrnA [Clostridia bacterium]|nr:bifunctional oligoribonuclease/PAP phosphatase NrnA [Clostridia bacterium]